MLWKQWGWRWCPEFKRELAGERRRQWWFGEDSEQPGGDVELVFEGDDRGRRGAYVRMVGGEINAAIKRN